MTAAGPDTSRHAAFMVAVFALLACNTAYYLYAGTLSKGLDAAAWLVLLALFALESGTAGRIRAPRAAAALRALRVAAAAGIGVAAIGYVLEQDSLDAINTCLWIAVVALLECEVRLPHFVAQHRTGFGTIAAMLYAALAILVAVWAWRGEWMDAYDALLWLIAFATIEMDLLQLARRDGAA